MGASGTLELRDRSAPRAGGLCWAATAEIFVAEEVAKFAWPHYSLAQDDISFLGVTRCGPLYDTLTHSPIPVCSPLHAAMNAGLILLGPLTLAGIALSWSAWPGTRLSLAGRWLLALAALGPTLCGLCPVDVAPFGHLAGALLFFVAGAVAVGMLSMTLRARHPGLALFGLVLAAVSLAASASYPLQIHWGLGRGGIERIASYTLSLWIVSMGVRLALGGRDTLR